LNLNKIATLAAIKWKKLSRDQQQIYEKKLDEMNKLPIEEFQHSRSKPEGNIDANLVKKEFIYENEDA
jgi:mRNA-degrading endonuclease RelE of RelBE toxin-antitoxin system